MRKIMVANPKGGCGKSTIATHLATWFARSDQVVYLGDMDRQKSAHFWLEQRPETAPRILLWKQDSEENLVFPGRADVAILDTPAGLQGRQLKNWVKEMDYILIPVTPSRFDMQASERFFEELAELKSVRKERVTIGAVAMRVDPRTHSTRQLIDFLGQFDLPLVTCIRSAQKYVTASDSGLTIFDSHKEDISDWFEWKPLFDWLTARKDD